MSKNQELEELYTTISQIYLKNTAYLSKKHPELFNKIQEFEKLHIENYFLEFENSHFELKNKNRETYYNCDPFFDAQKRCERIEEKPAFKLIKDSYVKDITQYNSEVNAYKMINEYLELTDKTYCYNKFIFIGTLLGVHLNDLDQQLHSDAYLIIEKSLEVFRLSMFLTDYEALSNKSKLFFCIQEDYNLNKITQEFLSYKSQYNTTIHFEVANHDSLEYIDKLAQFFVDRDPLNYPFSEYLISLERSLHYQQHYPFLKLNTTYDILKSKPILFLGAGPSLAQNIEWVYMNQDYFTISCAAGTLKRLELLDIIPDIILTIDGQYKQIARQFNVQKKYYENAILLASCKTDPRIIEEIQPKNLFIIQDSFELINEAGVFTGVTVGDVGLDILLRLGANELYILGFDAALSSKGKSHDGTHTKKVRKLEKNDILKHNGIKSSESLFQIPGNFKESVFTLTLYKQMIESINEKTCNLNTNIKLYNLSDGAKLAAFKPLYTKEITLKNTIDKVQYNTVLKNILKSISILIQNPHSLSKQEKKVLKKLLILNETNFIFQYKTIAQNYHNTLLVQIIDMFFTLMHPYAQKEDGEVLLFKQFKELLIAIKKILG